MPRRTLPVTEVSHEAPGAPSLALRRADAQQPPADKAYFPRSLPESVSEQGSYQRLSAEERSAVRHHITHIVSDKKEQPDTKLKAAKVETPPSLAAKSESDEETSSTMVSSAASEATLDTPPEGSRLPFNLGDAFIRQRPLSFEEKKPPSYESYIQAKKREIEEPATPKVVIVSTSAAPPSQSGRADLAAMADSAKRMADSAALRGEASTEQALERKSVKPSEAQKKLIASLQEELRLRERRLQQAQGNGEMDERRAKTNLLSIQRAARRQAIEKRLAKSKEGLETNPRETYFDQRLKEQEALSKLSEHYRLADKVTYEDFFPPEQCKPDEDLLPSPTPTTTAQVACLRLLKTIEADLMARDRDAKKKAEESKAKNQAAVHAPIARIINVVFSILPLFMEVKKLFPSYC